MQAVKVLLIEDSALTADLVPKQFASDNRFSVCIASSLADGDAKLSSEPFDVVLVDLGLPDARGLVGPKYLMEKYPHIPIMVFTGDGHDEETQAEAFNLGVEDWLHKADYTRRDLIDRTIAAVRRHRRTVEQIELARLRAQRDVAPMQAQADKITQSLAEAAPIKATHDSDPNKKKSGSVDLHSKRG